jgi:hypothetical protein
MVNANKAIESSLHCHGDCIFIVIGYASFTTQRAPAPGTSYGVSIQSPQWDISSIGNNS